MGCDAPPEYVLIRNRRFVRFGLRINWVAGGWLVQPLGLWLEARQNLTRRLKQIG